MKFAANISQFFFEKILRQICENLQHLAREIDTLIHCLDFSDKESLAFMQTLVAAKQMIESIQQTLLERNITDVDSK